MTKTNEAASANNGGSKMTLIVALAALIVIAGMSVVMFKNNANSTKKEVVGVEVSLGEFMVNLADQKQTRYLKTDVVLEVKDDAVEALKGKGEESGAPAPVRDAVIGVLSAYTYDELITGDGREELKNDIISSVNERLKGEHVIGVFFNEFTMQ